MRGLARIAAALVALSLVGCGAPEARTDLPEHHTAEGFQNRYLNVPHGLRGLLRWRWERIGHEVAAVDFPLSDNNPAFLKANRSEPTLTWIGHATFLLQLGGLNILTDPMFSRRASPFTFAGPERWAPPGLTLAELPRIDVAVISHDHYDHLDAASVQALAEQAGGAPLFLVPLGIKAHLLDFGYPADRVRELDWWDEVAHQGATFAATPVQHFSGRWINDRNATLWAGWMIRAAGKQVYFAGDTGYSPDFKDTQARYGDVDLALIPIGAYAPRWFMQPVHVNPAEAVQIHQDLRARYSVGMHWGTFNLTDEPMDEPPRALAEARAAAGIAAEQFFAMRHGETRRLAALIGADSP